MTSTEIISTLDRLRIKKEAAFSGTFPNGPALSEIVSELNAFPKQYKFQLKDFAKELKEDLFKRNINIKGFNLEQFQEVDNVVVEKSIALTEENRLATVKVEFIELFNRLIQIKSDHFEVLKGYFIVRLENNPLDSYSLIVLYDSDYFIQPIKKKIVSAISNAKFKSIEDYEKELEVGALNEGNLLCLLLLQLKTNNDDAIERLKVMLSAIFDAYKSFETYSLKNLSNNAPAKYESSISKEDFFEELNFVIGTLLSNGSINNEEEKIIKKLCRSFRTPLVIYKTLSGGNSGSKVIEVRPKKELGPEHEKRYIIKYSEKTAARKIHKEYEYFGKYIEGYKQFNDYECKYEKTLIFEGLRYSYAISDTESESYSYKQILEKTDNIFHLDKVKIIDELYSIRLFETWADSVEKIKCPTSQIYSPYVDPDKIIIEIEKILDKSSELVKSDELVVNFFKIWNTVFDFNEKICHGDLHTENFFKDKNGVYLIDFGYTGKRHALLDYTSLECSIKFKHCPFYIGIEELKNIETELLELSVPLFSYRFTTKRTYLLEMLEIIKSIRKNAILFQVDTNSNAEYLLSLFIMTFRQIRYLDMNQLYAYHSALILSKRLIQLFDLRSSV